ETETRRLARAERHARLERLITGVAAMRLHVEPRDDALPSIFAEAHDGGARDRSEDRRAEDVADLRAGHEKKGEREEQEDDGAAEVGLLHAEHDEQPRHDQVRKEADVERLD